MEHTWRKPGKFWTLTLKNEDFSVSSRMSRSKMDCIQDLEYCAKSGIRNSEDSALGGFWKEVYKYLKENL